MLKDKIGPTKPNVPQPRIYQITAARTHPPGCARGVEPITVYYSRVPFLVTVAARASFSKENERYQYPQHSGRLYRSRDKHRPNSHRSDAQH